MNEHRASVKTYSEPVFSKQFVSWSEFTDQTPLDTHFHSILSYSLEWNGHLFPFLSSYLPIFIYFANQVIEFFGRILKVTTVSGITSGPSPRWFLSPKEHKIFSHFETIDSTSHLVCLIFILFGQTNSRPIRTKKTKLKIISRNLWSEMVPPRTCRRPTNILILTIKFFY